MAKDTVSRKQLLKEPDQFITFSGKLIELGRTHLKTILIGVGSVLVLLLVVAITRQVSDRNENQASEKIEKAVAKYAVAVQEGDPKSAYDEVKGDFQAIFDAYGSKNATAAARIVYGDISYEAGDVDTAIAMYRLALDDFNHSPSLKNIILSGLGHAYLVKADYKESISYFEMITSDEEKTMKSDALYNLAWLYETTGDPEKSASLYKQLLADFPDGPYGDLVKDKIRG
jgi:tetratricopeptide (TPR) repeat protein